MQNLSNYPPGVTGNEYQIAGPDSWWDEDRFCPTCDTMRPHFMEATGSVVTAACAKCDRFEEVDDDSYWEDGDETEPAETDCRG